MSRKGRGENIEAFDFALTPSQGPDETFSEMPGASSNKHAHSGETPFLLPTATRLQPARSCSRRPLPRNTFLGALPAATPSLGRRAREEQIATRAASLWPAPDRQAAEVGPTRPMARSGSAGVDARFRDPPLQGAPWEAGSGRARRPSASPVWQVRARRHGRVRAGRRPLPRRLLSGSGRAVAGPGPWRRRACALLLPDFSNNLAGLARSRPLEGGADGPRARRLAQLRPAACRGNPRASRLREAPPPAALRAGRGHPAEARGAPGRRGRDRPRHGQPRPADAAPRDREDLRGGPQPAQPPLLGVARASRTCAPRSASGTRAATRSSSTPRARRSP